MKNKLILRKSMVVAIMATPMFAWATLPTDSAYATDPQNSYVQDQTSDGLSQLNMVMCIMDSMKTADLVNQGPYIALVDKNKCDSQKQSSASNSTAGSSGATAAPDYMNAVVDVTRTDNTTPMLAKIWMSMTEEGNPVNIFVHLTATTSPTDLPPYGKFRMDYIGKASGTTMFNGFINADGADISYLENGQNGGSGSGTETRALAMTSSSTDAGSGIMETPDFSGASPTTKTFNFAFDSSETAFTKGVFRRDDGTTDVCFDRDITASSKSTWSYGTYNANDGTRVDTANPGFPVIANEGSNSYYGYASYWGINFQGLDLNSRPEGAVTGVTITDQRPGNTTTYTLSKSSGKLTRWAQNQSTLSAMDGIPFNSWVDLTNQTTDTTNVTGGENWQMEWDNANSRFVVLGKQFCSSNGCTLTALPAPANVTGTVFDTQPVNGWSDSFGGNINIPSTGVAHGGSDEVDYYTQSDVLPGDASVTNLVCLSNCPTAASLTSFNTSGGSPFDSNTATQYGTGTTTVTYSFGESGLSDSGGALGSIVTDKTRFSGQYQNGVMSGRLFAALDTGGGCPSNCEPNTPTEYYTWQTGADQWNQSEWLTKTSDSSVVSFDPPQNVAYTVPTGSAYGTWAGKTLQLQFSGFGNLQGIPGGCVDPSDNSPADCGTPNVRYVPDFSIPDGATMSLTSTTPATPLIVKSLDSEVRLGKIAGCAGVELAQPSNNLTLPSAADLHDPSSSLDTFTLGTEPTVTDAPKVIDGVVQ